MYIALDYDDTYTLDPAAWDEFILMMQEHQHEVFIVTDRSKIPNKHSKHLSDLVDGIYYTEGKAKKKFMGDFGINIDVWCDNNPKRILKDKKSKAQ